MCLLALQLLLYPAHHRHSSVQQQIHQSLLVPQSLLIQGRDKNLKNQLHDTEQYSRVLCVITSSLTRAGFHVCDHFSFL